MCDRFLSVFSLVSRIPVPFRFRFDCSRMDFFLPVTGIFAALSLFLPAYLIFFLVKNTVAACILALAIQYLCFNLFHLDGLADTADAFLGAADREKTFAILKDSRIGVYGLFAALMNLALKIVLLHHFFTLSWEYFYLAVFFSLLAGRFAAALIPCRCPPARTDGLGVLVKDSRMAFALAGMMAAAILVFLPLAFFSGIKGGMALVLLSGQVLGVAAAAAVLSAFFYGHVYCKRIGGYTGDALGAAIETGELAALFLVTVLAAWRGF